MSKKAAKKFGWGKILGIVLLVLVILLVLVVMFISSVVKTGVEQVGSRVTKCNITVRDVDISLLRGRVEINDFVVGNPEGFKTESAFKLGKIYVDMSIKSLFTDRIIINEVQIIAPEITYEIAPLKLQSNIGAIQENVTAFLPASDGKEEKPEVKTELAEDKSGKKVQINHVLVKDGKIRLSATFAGGNSLPLPLPKIEMNDIGKEKETSTVEAAAQVLNHTLTSVITVAKDGIKALGTGVKNIGSSIGTGVKNILGLGKEAPSVPAEENK